MFARIGGNAVRGAGPSANGAAAAVAGLAPAAPEKLAARRLRDRIESIYRNDLIIGVGDGAMVCSEFIDYLVARQQDGDKRLPPLAQISAETSVGMGRLREQVAVARALGLIETTPKRGIEPLAYDFLPAVRMSLEAGIALNEDCFQEFADLRMRLEISFWADAAQSLRGRDLDRLEALCAAARAKLGAAAIEIPHEEHKEFHLRIFGRLDNAFVLGLLAAYWEAYKSVAPRFYEELSHLQAIWRYHQRIVQALRAGDVAGSQALHVEHMRLLEVRRGQAA